MSVVPATIGRWVKWPTAKRHALDESGVKTICGYQVPEQNVKAVIAPFTWREYEQRREAGEQGMSWFRDHPKHYCALCMRITGRA